jgi:hypothetical protein
MISKIDPHASTIEINRVTNEVRIDGMLAFKAFERDGSIWLQFCDRDRLRSKARRPPTRYIEVCLESFWEKLNSEIGGEDGI